MKANLKLETAAHAAVQAAIDCGVKDFCICPGARAAEFLALLKTSPQFSMYTFYDERSAAFFALGKSQVTQRPVAVIVTSGSALAHLLAAAMEAYYTGTPLLFITADRPRRFRGTNAPQSCEQERFYGVYTPFFCDIAWDEPCDLVEWDQRAPAHINVCLEEPNHKDFTLSSPLDISSPSYTASKNNETAEISSALTHFLERCHLPFVIVGKLKVEDKESVLQFLLKLKAPVFLEAISGLREDPRLKELQVTRCDWPRGYPMDGVIRIGGVPTFRFWRDLEESNGTIPVFSINHQPFSGLSWGTIHCVDLKVFFDFYAIKPCEPSEDWKELDRKYETQLSALYQDEPTAEASLVHALSTHIPPRSFIFLGNSLPIREWDQSATFNNKGFKVRASRGINGIDGQTSTFFGAADPSVENWCILGDLTTLHDLSAPWILPQLDTGRLNIVVVNNGGGRIFARILKDIENQNPHSLGFKPFAEMWGMLYERWKSIPPYIPCTSPRLIELVPDYEATQRFWQKAASL